MEKASMEGVVRDRLYNIIDEDYFYYGSLDDDSDLVEAGFDSLAVFSIAIRLEKEFNIEIETKEIHGIKSLNDIVRIVVSKLDNNQ